MRGPGRTAHLFLAAFLLASTVSVAAHYSAHANANVERCLLCVSHASPNHAATAPDGAFTAAEAPAQTLSQPVALRPASGYHITPLSRGPPPASC